jgi:hypothetical protein
MIKNRGITVICCVLFAHILQAQNNTVPKALVANASQQQSQVNIVFSYPKKRVTNSIGTICGYLNPVTNDFYDCNGNFKFKRSASMQVNEGTGCCEDRIVLQMDNRLPIFKSVKDLKLSGILTEVKENADWITVSILDNKDSTFRMSIPKGRGANVANVALSPLTIGDRYYITLKAPANLVDEERIEKRNILKKPLLGVKGKN